MSKITKNKTKSDTTLDDQEPECTGSLGYMEYGYIGIWLGLVVIPTVAYLIRCVTKLCFTTV